MRTLLSTFVLASLLSGCTSYAVPQGADAVVGMGDSVMAGTHCDCSGPVASYAHDLTEKTGRTFDSRNFGVNGATTTSVIAQLSTKSVRVDLKSARVVVLIVGANDLQPQLNKYRASSCPYSCYHGAVLAMGRRLGTLLGMIDRIRGGREDSVLVTDYWNVFLDGRQGIAQRGRAEILWGRKVSRDANASICNAASAHGAICVDTYKPFLAHGSDPSRYLASDGDHPNKAGVALIARRLLAATPTSVEVG